MTGLAAVAGIVAAVYGIFKWATWKFQKTPEEKREEIDSDVRKEQEEYEKKGRPI